MKQLKYIICCVFSLFLCSCNTGTEKGLEAAYRYVDPFIGTGGHGHTFPGATRPYGMVQLSPDTRTLGWDGCSGYHYSDSSIIGFSHTHLSGTGIGDYGDILFMPFQGDLQLEAGEEQNPDGGYRSRFTHEKEKAMPGYYTVKLVDDDIDVELTASERAGFHRYTFNKSGASGIIIDLTHTIHGHQNPLNEIHVISDTEVAGIKITNGWSTNHHVYFYARFNKPFTYKLIDTGKEVPGSNETASQSVKAVLLFDANAGEEVLAKVGISAVDTDGAKNNVDTEIKDWNFDRVVSDAKRQWIDQLNKITVEGGSEDRKKIFYTALYHCSISPNIFTDADHRYRGVDHKIHTAEGFTNYTVFSLWDTFRAFHPLLTIIDPERDNDFIRSLLSKREEGGILPKWELAANYTGTMIGYHAVSVITDAYMKGIRDYDVDQAYQACIATSLYDTTGIFFPSQVVKDKLMPIARKYYNELGYIPADLTIKSVSEGMEYAYCDWCISQMAKDRNDTATYNVYARRAGNYKNYFDAATGFMRGKNADGSWETPFNPRSPGKSYVEGNAWQWNWYVPQDVYGYIELMGGREVFVRKLDSLFSVPSYIEGERRMADATGLIGQYAHGNEPSHHIAHLYNYLGEPWKTQQLVDSILYSLYFNDPDGLSGNEDCGQMSAWYLLNAMGFYSFCPGRPEYSIGRPVFDKVTLHLPNKQVFVVEAKNNSKANKYIQSATLNNQPLNSPRFNHSDILQGGHLTLEMGREVNTGWGSLPWHTEAPLKEVAKTTVIESPLNPTNPMPRVAMSINNLKMRTTMWGPPNRVTVSLTKNNVWDRRVNWYTPPTLEEITEGAFSPANKDYEGIQHNLTLRPKNLGWLKKEGGEIDPYRNPIRYAFPALKPVGQIIVGIDPLADAGEPVVTQNCGTGLTSLHIEKGLAKANLDYVLLMDKDVYAIRGNLSGIDRPVWLRLYRHKDTSHTMYMTADGKQYTVPEAEKDKDFNGPIDPPTSGTDGKYFWISQRMPAEKTFPDGFEYVMMGVMTTSEKVTFTAEEGTTGLGTPPENQPVRGDWIRGTRAAIADAPGAAATAAFSPGKNGQFEAFVTVVTSTDGTDLLALAKKRLDEMQAGGFDNALKSNTQWWDDFYDRREEGRVFGGNSAANCTEDIPTVYQSYADSHGGGTKTDMRRFESSASYVMPEQDIQGWNSGPCYNEIFTTSTFVRNRADNQDLWKQIVEHWLPGGQEAAENVFHMPGAFISHGYLPPIKPDRYPHVTITLELCLGTMAQIIRPAWDEWDYGGDIDYLRKECYPLMKQMATFYSAYAKKGNDGFYHVIPSVQEESWGIYPEFSHTKDVISSLCMFRWGLVKTAEAAELLGVDADLAKQWRSIAEQLLPYPTWERPEGKVFAHIPGIEPVRLPEDHYADAAAYLVVLADEINLDSPQEVKDMMIRSVRSLPSASTVGALMLLGIAPEADQPRYERVVDDPETLLNSRSGRIHLFPAAPKNKSVAFRHFQARGGFLVSASRKAEEVVYLEIQSRRDIDCQLMNPWPGKPVVIRDVKNNQVIPADMDRTNGECFVFPTKASHTYVINKQEVL
ncbi:MAG: GH92 family glycosyl hydrolase [Tannerella sp.]|nr:GH92 family glycosyl hydrolase [Tannerella sp.]